VTRLKDYSSFKILKIHELAELAEDSVIQNADIELSKTYKTTGKNETVRVRKVNCIDPLTKEKLHFLSNTPNINPVIKCMLCNKYGLYCHCFYS
jgi:hypothetical protein